MVGYLGRPGSSRGRWRRRRLGTPGASIVDPLRAVSVIVPVNRLPRLRQICKPLCIGGVGECLPRGFGARGGVDECTARDFDGTYLALPFEVGVPDVFLARHGVPPVRVRSLRR